MILIIVVRYPIVVADFMRIEIMRCEHNSFELPGGTRSMEKCRLHFTAEKTNDKDAGS